MTAEQPSVATRLCAECGMCCNGVLFHSVVLQPEDSARALAALGLKIKRKKGQAFFRQPCSAYRGSLCAIYEQRPVRCRLFACRQLLRVQTGEVTEASALEKIHEARARTAKINALIHQVAETNPMRALAQRGANALTTSEKTPLHDELEAAMHDLETLLEMDFRVP